MPTPYATGAAADKLQREAQILYALVRLESAVEEAEKSFANLVQRCETVQRASPPDGQSEGPKVAEALCPLAERIRKATERVYGLAGNITGLMSRIEL